MPTLAISPTDWPLHWIVLLPLLGAAINLLVGRKLSRRTVHLIACGSVLAALLLSLSAVVGSLYPLWKASRTGGAAPELRDLFFTWIQSGSLRVEMAFLLDPLSAVMILTITFVGFLIHVYSTGYMAHDPRPAAYFGYLNLFTAAMLLLVLGDSLPVMFIGWEGVGLCSYLLIGFWFDKEKYANAGRKAFIVNRIGDLGFLLGILLLYANVGAVDYAGLEASLAQLVGANSPLLTSYAGTGLSLTFFAGLFLFVGACGKSAQIPLYVWLPDAMAGPTPVSALIHAATMVTAGVYMVARLGFLFLTTPEVMMIIAAIGATTAIVAAVIGFAQTDIKKVLAYSTVSQLGFMFAAVGCGAFTAGVFHLFTHAFFKAGLFLAAGSVMHAMGDRTEIMGMGGLRKKLPITHATFFIYCLAIAGVVPFAGFFSKDEILLGAYVAQLPYWPEWFGRAIWAVLAVTALFTAFYMWRLYFLVFAGESRADEATQRQIHESPATMTGPLVVLAIGAVLLGFLGLPHIGGLPNAFAAWLSGTFGAWQGTVLPEAHASTGTTITLMAIALGSALAGIGAAWALYRNGPGALVQRLVVVLAPLHRWAANKFYVDELYDLLIIRPFRLLAKLLFAVVDRVFIDTLFVNGTGWVTRTFGRLARRAQNGDVQRYFVAMLLGVVGIVSFATCGKPRFEATTAGGTAMRFVADVGAGPGANGAKVEWDFTGDGKIDATGADVTWSFPAPGSHAVTLRVEDGLFREVKQLKRVITVAAVGLEAAAAPAEGAVN